MRLKRRRPRELWGRRTHGGSVSADTYMKWHLRFWPKNFEDWRNEILKAKYFEPCRSNKDMSLAHSLFKKKPLINSYPTPQPLFDQYDAEFHFTVDVAATKEDTKCARYYTIHDDGLQQDWSGETVWCNPPWGALTRWVPKAYQESLKGATVVMLIPARVETRYWHDFILPYAEVRWIRGKVRFSGMSDRLPFPCAIVIFRPQKIPKTLAEAGAIGGKVAASRMTPEQRKERARKAGMAKRGYRKIRLYL